LWKGRPISDWIDEILSEKETDFHLSWNESEKCLEPLVDVTTNENNIIITLDLPCVQSKEDISLSVMEKSIEVDAKMHQSIKWEKWGTVQKEIEFNSFKKVLSLPEKIDPSKTEAKFDSGILVITIPRIQKKFDIKVE
jgi:HSP20 family protein